MCFAVFNACVRAIRSGELIKSLGAKDKEFHFQNWFETRLREIAILFDDPGRNTYPDYRLVEFTEGYEIKALAWPGREKDYDSNSQVPSGVHNGRTIYYVFGRYPAADAREAMYPVIDLVICHGDFLNAESDYVHKNKSVKGFGSYGDIMIRDRKMYVAPTPFALTSGTAGIQTLIVPEHTECPKDFEEVGRLVRTETKNLIVG